MSNTPSALTEGTTVGVTAEAGEIAFPGVTMSLDKLTAGSGYDYLTRQVAALDATDKGRTGLASYLHRTGRVAWVWVGSGMDGIDGLDVDDPVTAEQMGALFRCGLHPLAELRLQHLEGPSKIPCGK
jgi:TrwC relaxase